MKYLFLYWSIFQCINLLTTYAIGRWRAHSFFILKWNYKGFRNKNQLQSFCYWGNFESCNCIQLIQPETSSSKLYLQALRIVIKLSQSIYLLTYMRIFHLIHSAPISSEGYFDHRNLDDFCLTKEGQLFVELFLRVPFGGKCSRHEKYYLSTARLVSSRVISVC